MQRLLIYIAISIALTSCGDSDTAVDTARTITTADSTPTQNDETVNLKRPQKLESIEDIQNEYAYISSQVISGALDSSYFRYNCHEEKKGTVTYYTQNGQLLMIRHDYSEYSHHSATDSYFLKDSSLFFIYYDRLSWSFDSEAQAQDATKDDITEQRLYIINGKPVKCLEKKFTIRSSAKDNPSSKEVANQVVDCPPLKSISKDLEKLRKYRDWEDYMECLEG